MASVNFKKYIKFRLLPLNIITRVLLLTIFGLVIVFVVANTIVRSIVYENMIAFTQFDGLIYVNEIDAWFNQSISIIMLSFFVLMILLIFTIVTFLFYRVAKDMEERRVSEELLEMIFNNSPLASSICGNKGNPKGCNAEAIKMFNLRNKQEFVDKFDRLSPLYQPDGTLSKDKAEALTKLAFEEGRQSFEWWHQDLEAVFNPIK